MDHPGPSHWDFPNWHPYEETDHPRPGSRVKVSKSLWGALHGLWHSALETWLGAFAELCPPQLGVISSRWCNIFERNSFHTNFSRVPITDGNPTGGHVEHDCSYTWVWIVGSASPRAKDRVPKNGGTLAFLGDTFFTQQIHNGFPGNWQLCLAHIGVGRAPFATAFFQVSKALMTIQPYSAIFSLIMFFFCWHVS